MSTGIIRAFEARLDDVDRRGRVVTCRAATAALDHYRTTIHADGMELGAYRRNNVILWEHGLDARRGTLPVGLGVKVEPVEGPKGPELLAQVRFHTDEFSDRLFEMYRSGDLKAWSVRIVPVARSCSPPTSEEIRARPELAGCVTCYRKSVLAEISAVSVPGNPEALTVEQARSLLALESRGLSLRPDLAARARFVGRPGAGTVLPPLGGRPVAVARAEKVAAVRRGFGLPPKP
jgi:hypothetical protein